MSYSLSKKLSVKGVVGNVKKLVADGEIADGQKIARFVGSTHSVLTGTGDNGDWVAFKGNFAGTNLLTGENFRSGKCFLPDVAGDILHGLVAESESAVEFAFDISIKKDESSATGYIYNAVPLIQPAQDDPMERMMAALPPVAETMAIEAQPANGAVEEKPTTKAAKK